MFCAGKKVANLVYTKNPGKKDLCFYNLPVRNYWTRYIRKGKEKKKIPQINERWKFLFLG